MSVNKVILVGRLGRDPETRYLPSGDAVCNFSIATDEQWKDRNGERQSRTEWHSITLFGKLGKIAGQYLKKGSQVFVEGRIQSRKYNGKDGIERTAVDIIGSEMKMLGSRGDGESNQPPVPSNSAPPAAPTRQQRQPVQPVEDVDDGIPF